VDRDVSVDTAIQPESNQVTWASAVRSLKQPYPVTVPMVALLVLVPFYIFIGEMMPGRAVHVPEIALDRLIPLQPLWALIYGPLYLFLILLPVFVVRQEVQIRRTFWAYLTVWSIAYVWFILFPTKGPRPTTVIGEGFSAWGLRFLYSADPPYNCFPSLHVAHSFVSALTCWRVHRTVGLAAMMGAAVVAISTLFTKQHYVLDVLSGFLLAAAAYAIWLRRCPPSPPLESRLAPLLALMVFAIVSVALLGFWVAYQVSVG
jgi:membrane-associated phospholipid phosphatase